VIAVAHQDEIVLVEELAEEAPDPSFFAGVFVGIVVVGLIFVFT
jgi:hypothetical protein